MLTDKKPISLLAFLSMVNPSDNGLHSEERFLDLLHHETEKAQRSMRPLPLVLLNLSEAGSYSQKQKAVRGLVSQLFSSTREIDIKGWFREGTVIGILFREIGGARDWLLAREAIMRRVQAILDSVQTSHDAVSWHLLSPYVAGRPGAGQDRLEAFQWAVQASRPISLDRSPEIE